MPDISMCNNQACPLKDQCYRHTAVPDPYRQSYMDFKWELPLGCLSFWSNAKESTVKKEKKKDKKKAKGPDYTGMINEIMENFEFNKVHRTMVALNWEWYIEGSHKRVPTMDEIESQAESLLEKVAESPHKKYNVGTGGFLAKKNKHGMELVFELTSWDTQWQGDQ